MAPNIVLHEADTAALAVDQENHKDKAVQVAAETSREILQSESATGYSSDKNASKVDRVSGARKKDEPTSLYIEPLQEIATGKPDRESFKLLTHLLLAFRQAELESKGLTSDEVKNDYDKNSAALTNEIDNNGKNTQELYKGAVDWLEQHGIPEMIKEAGRTGAQLTIPPIALHRIGEQWKMKLEIDTSIAPDAQAVEKLDSVFAWMAASKKEIALADLIESNNLPKDWLKRSATSPEREAEHAQCKKLVAFSLYVEDRVKMMDFFNRAGGRFPEDFPPGCNIKRDADGNIESANLALPTQLGINKGDENWNKLEELGKWLQKYEKSISKTMTTVAENAPLYCGDSSGSGDVSFGESKVKEHYNLRTFDYRTNTDAEGIVLVQPTMNHQILPFFSPYNLRRQTVGPQEIPLKPQTYKPDDLVPVSRNGEKHLIPAKELQQLHDDDKSSSKNWERGKIALDLALNGLIFVSGVGAYYKAATGLQKLIGVGRCALASTTFLENDGALDTTAGRVISKARTGLMAVDIIGTGFGASAFCPAGQIANTSRVGKYLNNFAKVSNMKAGVAAEMALGGYVSISIIKHRIEKHSDKHDPLEGAKRTQEMLEERQDLLKHL